MDKHYMDYGNLVKRDQYIIPSVKLLIDYERKGDVYRLTHDGEGKSLSFINKAFISFTYGGKKIEDFGLIATSIDNRYNGESPPEHEDFVTDARMLNGQYYWGSHYSAREMTISLATDGMTQMQLDRFKYWFQAGEMRELIMAEHPNRGIIARVAQAPQISMVPFPRKKRTVINGKEIEVTIILYKGNIQLNLVMDDPFWYAIHDVFGAYVKNENNQKIIVDKWIDVNNNVIELLDDDALKIVVLDNIPTASMINNQINFANNLKLSYYHPYKYTLTSEEILHSTELNDLQGTPLINLAYIVGLTEVLSLRYPLSGAIVGPIYDIGYALDEKIITINNRQWKANKYLDETTGLTLFIDEENQEDEDKEFVHYTIELYLPVKSGQIILTNANNNKLKIMLYLPLDKLQLTSNPLIVLNNDKKNYVIDSPVYLRMLLILYKNNIINDEIINFNNYVTVLLTTFRTLVKGERFTKLTILNYFYSGNAPSYPTINFSVPIVFNLNGYINSFNNFYTANNNQENYNTITLLGEFKHHLKITNPSIFNSYNKVIQKLHTRNEENIVELIQWFREEIGHAAVRNWIVNCINIYYNNNLNLDHKDNKIIIGHLGKDYLLLCMPYLFASVLLSNIVVKLLNNIPTTITTGDRLLGGITFTTNYSRLKINRNDQNNYIINYFVGQPLTIKALVENKNAIFYEWHYSYDKILWFQMESNWYDDTTDILKCNSMSLSDNNIYLRCIISNNVYTVGKDEEEYRIQIQKISDDLLIECTKLNYTLNQNNNYNRKSTSTPNWKITGHFFDGILNDINYKPKIYYQRPTSNNWIEWLDEFNTETVTETETDVEKLFRQQISNCKLSYTSSKVYLFIQPRENILKELRGTKFKVRFYKISLDNTVLNPLENLNNYCLSDIITINIKRLLTEEAIIRLTKTTGQDTVTITTFEDVKKFYQNDNITFTVNNISNIRDTTLKKVEVRHGNGVVWTQYDLTNNDNTFSWSTNLNQTFFNTFSEEFYLRFSFTDYGETWYLPSESGIFFVKIDTTAAQQTIANFEAPEGHRLALYVTSQNIQVYSGTSFLIKVRETNVMPEEVNGQYKLQFHCYYNSELINNMFDMNTAESAGNVFVLENESKDVHTLIEGPDLTTADSGYYKMQVLLYLKQPGTSQYRNPIDISPLGYVQVSVIDEVQFSSTITCNMDNWYYYSGEATDKWSDSLNKVASFANGKNLELIFTINKGYTSDCGINVYRVRSSTNSNTYAASSKYVTITDNNDGSAEIKLSIPYKSTQQTTLYSNNKNPTYFYCLVTDRHTIIHNSNEKRIIFHDEKTKREINITNYTKLNATDTWYWVEKCLVLDSIYVKDENGSLQVLTDICPAITSTYNWDTNDVLTISGMPRSNSNPSATTTQTSAMIAADLDYDWPACALRASDGKNTDSRPTGYLLGLDRNRQGQPVGYIKEYATGTRLNIKQFYQGFNAQYQTVLTVPINVITNLSKVNITLHCTIPNNSKYKYSFRTAQGESECATEQIITYAKNGKDITLESTLLNNTTPLKVQVKFYRESNSTQQAWVSTTNQLHFESYSGGGNIYNSRDRTFSELISSNYSDQFDNWKETATAQLKSIIGYY